MEGGQRSATGGAYAPQAVAGWYPDPADPNGVALRFWDGAGWTEHRSVPAAAVNRGAAGSRGLPLFAIPVLAVFVALIVTTAYATFYSLLQWGDIGSADVFFTTAAASMLGGPFNGSISSGRWFFDAPLGEVWALTIPLLTIVFVTAVLAAFSRASAGARLLAGALVAVPLVIFTVALVLITPLFAGWYSYYTDDLALSAAVGATIVGLLGGLSGALLSLPLSPPRSSRGP